MNELATEMLLQDWRYKAGIEEGQSLAGSQLRHLEAQRDLALMALYKADPVVCANLCDSMLDRRGALLGRIRAEIAKENP